MCVTRGRNFYSHNIFDIHEGSCDNPLEVVDFPVGENPQSQFVVEVLYSHRFYLLRK